jgi:hypothetical protein
MYDTKPTGAYIKKEYPTRILQVGGIVLLGFLLFTGGASVYGVDTSEGSVLNKPPQTDNQEYAIITYPGCPMSAETCTMPTHTPTEEKQEFAWAVTPYVVITFPDTTPELLAELDGTLQGVDIFFYNSNYIWRVKAFISRRPLEVSKDIPEQIINVYESLEPILQDDGGVLTIVERMKRLKGIHEVGS